MPLATYVDLETATQTDSCLNPEDKKNVCSVLCSNFCISP